MQSGDIQIKTDLISRRELNLPICPTSGTQMIRRPSRSQNPPSANATEGLNLLKTTSSPSPSRPPHSQRGRWRAKGWKGERELSS